MNDDSFDRHLAYWISKDYLLPMNNLTYKINQNFLQQISLITSPFEQYARAYLLIYEQEIDVTEKNPSVLTKLYQKRLLAKLDSQNIVSVLASSSSVISNALRTLKSSNRSVMLRELRQVLTKIFQPMAMHLRAKL